MWLLEEILCTIGQPTHVLHGQYVCVVYCKISGVCSVISTASGEWSSPAEPLHYNHGWIIGQLSSIQYCIVIHLPLYCCRRVVNSSCDWDKASSSLLVLLHQS